MKKIFFLFIYILFILTADAQDILYEKEIKLKRTILGEDSREAYPVTNYVDKSVSLFLIDKSSVKGFLFDKDFNLMNEIEGEKADSKYEDLLGSNIVEDTYTLFFSNKSHSLLQSVSYNFISKAVNKNVVDLAIKKERYLGSVTFNNRFYFLTIPKRSSTLKVYIFNSTHNYEIRSYDFPDHHFTSDELRFTLYDALLNQADPGIIVTNDKDVLVNIDNEIPNPLDLTASLFKLYTYNDNIVFTLNNQPLTTTIISIDVNTLEASLNSYKHAASNCNGFPASSNSYIHDNHLYQLKVCTEAMTLSILDLKTGALVKEFNATAEEELAFKNTPILLEKKVTSMLLPDKNERVLTKTKQFLRKVESSDAGICVYKINGNLEMTLGGYTPIQRGGAPMGGGFTPRSTISTPSGMVSFPATYNPTYGGYTRYKVGTKYVYFKSLLSPDTYDHQPGIIQINAFDKIQTLTEAIKDKITAETIFKKDGSLILGYYLKGSDKYVMRQFKD